MRRPRLRRRGWRTRARRWVERRDAHVALERGVVVGRAGSRELRADLYRPPEPLETRPAVLLIHGGGWESGERAQLGGYGIALGRRGYLCVACEYRLSGEAPWPAQIHDIKTTLRWMRTNAPRLAIDPDRIAAWGNSAGGHLALFAAGTQNAAEFEGDGGHPGAGTDIAAVVAFYPPTELWRSSQGWSSIDALLGDDGSAEAAWAASPLRYVSEEFPPTLFIHGAADTTVPVDNSERMHAALTKHGVPSELHVYAGLPHAFDQDRQLGKHCADVGALFLDRYLAAGPRSEGEARQRARTTGEGARRRDHA